MLRCVDFQAGNLKERSKDLSALLWSVILPVQHPHSCSQPADPKCVGRMVNNPGGRRSRSWMKEDWSRWFDFKYWGRQGVLGLMRIPVQTDQHIECPGPTAAAHVGPDSSCVGSTAHNWVGRAEGVLAWGLFYPGRRRNPNFSALCGYRFGNRTKERGRRWLPGHLVTSDTTSDNRSWRWTSRCTRSPQSLKQRGDQRRPALKKQTGECVSPLDRGIQMMTSRATWDCCFGSPGTGRECGKTELSFFEELFWAHWTSREEWPVLACMVGRQNH